jgi:hypothetical protein
MKHYVFFLCLLTLVASCIYDPPRPQIEICNQTKDKVLFELHFDSAAYNSQWTASGIRKFLTYNYGFSPPGPETELVAFDTINFVQIYSLPPGSIFHIAGWGDKNKRVLYSRMKIITSSDTIIFNDIDAIKKSFSRIDKWHNQLVLK